MLTIGAFAVILDRASRVLLCHRRDDDLWNLPGGRVEAGESPWEGVVREVMEEVALVVRVDRLAGVYWKPEKPELVFSFVCSVLSGTPSVSEEADAVRFFEVDAIPRNTSAKQVERIRDALVAPGSTVFRTQTGPSSAELLAKGIL